MCVVLEVSCRPVDRPARNGHGAGDQCYGLGVCIQDGWHEQLVKRGWLGTQFPNVIRPGLTLAWGGLLVCAALAYRLVIRPRLRQVAEA